LTQPESCKTADYGKVVAGAFGRGFHRDNLQDSFECGLENGSNRENKPRRRPRHQMVEDDGFIKERRIIGGLRGAGKGKRAVGWFGI